MSLVIHNKRILTVRVKVNIKGDFTREQHAKIGDLLEEIDKLVKEKMPDKLVEVKL